MACLTPRFDGTSTAGDVVAGVDLSGEAAVVTGASSGIGIEIARALASTGAVVTLAVRDVDAGRRVALQIAAATGNQAVEVQELDLTSLASVRAFVENWTTPLRILICNAGVMAPPETYTANGWELQFATNHMGHFALALGLHNSLAAAQAARIVSVSSSAHGLSPVVFDDLFFEKRPYEPMQAYGQSKTANVLFAVEASRRWVGDGIRANAVMPGGVWTNVQRFWQPEVLDAAKASALASGLTLKTPEQGAATAVFVATSPDLEGVGGRYFEDCHESEVVSEIVDGVYGVREYAVETSAAERLWELSLGLLTEARYFD